MAALEHAQSAGPEGHDKIGAVISVDEVARQALEIAQDVNLDELDALVGHKPLLRIDALDAGYGQMEILHEFNLALGVPDAGREHSCTNSFCSIMQPKSAGKETIPVAYLDHIPPAKSKGGQGSCKRCCPRVQIILGVSDDSWFPRSPGRHMITDQFLLG